LQRLVNVALDKGQFWSFCIQVFFF
jgi:hypothetical protein